MTAWLGQLCAWCARSVFWVLQSRELFLGLRNALVESQALCRLATISCSGCGTFQLRCNHHCWYNMKYMLAYLLTSKSNKSAPKAPQVHENTRVEKGQLSFMLTGSQVIDWCDCLDTQVCQCFLPSSFFPFSCSFFANGLQPSVTLRGLPMTSSFSSSTAAPKQSCIKAWALSRSFNNFIHHYKTQAALSDSVKIMTCATGDLFSACRTHYIPLLSWGGGGMYCISSSLSAEDEESSIICFTFKFEHIATKHLNCN